MTWIQQCGAIAVHALGAARSLTPLPAEYLLSAIWQGGLLAAGAGLLLRAGPRLSAGARFILWAAVFVLVALLPLLAVPGAWLLSGPATGAAFAGRSMLHLRPGWALAIDAAWCAAAAASLVRTAADLLRMRSLSKDARPPAAESIPQEVKGLLASAPGRRSRAVALRLSSRVDSPCAVGLFDSAILVPEWLWAKLGPEELKQIVLHEMAHLRRGDDWSNLLQKLLCALCPLNPALLWVERRLCFEREMACDDAVLEATCSPRSYAACLTGIAEARLRRKPLTLAPSAWQRPSELTRRVQGILDRKGRLRPLLSAGVVSASLVLLLLAAGELARSPQIISFTTAPGNGGEAAARPLRADAGSLYRQAALRNRPLAPAARLREATFSYSRLSPAGRGALRPRPAHPTGLRRAAWRQQAAEGEQRIMFSQASGRSAWLVFAWWQPLQQDSIDRTLPAGLILAPQPQFLTFESPTGWIVFKI